MIPALITKSPVETKLPAILTFAALMWLLAPVR
jgi:hypothetical protein